MSKQHLSDPITLRLPLDLLGEIEAVAGACERSRSWVMVRALKAYMAQEGREILEIAQARRAIADGEGTDADDVLAELNAIIKGAAA
ncbi:MAG: ribbon-helix-helix domain-containing protein [Alphaproteobacteria bacterium]|uniref:CopG family ribbon-helix-helix protein n=1 Tax=unclassified Rhizobium TaxID=2613769 RepID=UPI0006BA0279|nr:ribbon-helix-helix protein, CopG family [Rhizobium sp. AAP116]MBU0739203.1 ribbon-helix-helix domain-containing protein [Alphaproteobacteria bacterium]MDZ7871920.1 ribbon-helix-helix protein, CopG family [Rhizobium sp.]KPF58393.1 CopG family transcriptional regulator [Rhizobium sp. AAP116]MBU0833941.1 ribbon-helix-helix domain-containing protein [Alphaproteobacteria bacterium]MBU1765075.1 ribbon-helix-helix domain-containing protein [Alphaproteobacteria bacterium]